MATLDPLNRHGGVLPSINFLELDKCKSERPDSRFPTVVGLNISTGQVGSPTTIYSGPPPPYSTAAAPVGSTQALSDYRFPPESTIRRSTRDESESSANRKSLPSIHEALSAPLSATVQHPPSLIPSTAVTQGYTEAPKGPSNPFSQPANTLRDVPFSSQPQSQVATPTELQQHKPSFSNSEPRSSVSGPFGYPASPRASGPPSFRPPFNTQLEGASASSPQKCEQTRLPHSYSQFSNPPSSSFNPTSEPYQFNGAKFEEQSPSYPRVPGGAYGDTVKRHLEGYDAEVGLNDIGEASARILDFSRIWAQRYHQGSRTAYYQDTFPGLHEIDDMMRQSHRTMEGLTRLRDIVIAQQTALSEQRARLARGSHADDEAGGGSDEFKAGGFAGGDAKKRRGKAAPPGRCHSCNRAETPEWRRGPDGARTLCNACGLHYAKLTRKIGVNKAAALNGSNLRPKPHDQ